jgi:hypothetical protein
MTVSLVWVNRFVHWKPSFGEGSPAQLSGLIALNRFLSEHSRVKATLDCDAVNSLRRSFAKTGSG